MPISENTLTIILVICYIIIFVTCLLEVLFPKWCWKTFESCKLTEEPSKEYFFRNQVAGIIGMFIITIIALMPTLISCFNK